MSTKRGPASQEVIGEPLTDEDNFWLDRGRAMVGESVRSIEEAAKQVITITSLAQAVYFAAVSFSKLHEAVGRLSGGQQAVLALALVSPLLCWVLALVFAIRVFKPEKYSTNLNSPSLIKDMHRRIIDHKQRQLQAAYWFLVLGFGPLIVNILLAFMLMP